MYHMILCGHLCETKQANEQKLIIAPPCHWIMNYNFEVSFDFRLLCDLEAEVTCKSFTLITVMTKSSTSSQFIG